MRRAHIATVARRRKSLAAMNDSLKKRTSRYAPALTEQQLERILRNMAPDLRIRLAEYCDATGQSPRAVIEVALEGYLERMQTIDKLESSAERTRRRLDDLFEAFARFAERCLAFSRSPNDRSN